MGDGNSDPLGMAQTGLCIGRRIGKVKTNESRGLIWTLL